MSELTDKSPSNSKKKETELKEVVRKMLAAGIPISSAEVERQSGLSHSFVYKPEMQKFIKEQKEKQKKEDLKIDTELQNFNLHTKLMASYIFAYSLLDEQEEFYKTAIAELKDRDKPFVINNGSDSAIKFICQTLSEETDPSKIAKLLNKFKVCFSESIPDWKEQLLEKLDKCLAKDILEKKYK